MLFLNYSQPEQFIRRVFVARCGKRTTTHIPATLLTYCPSVYCLRRVLARSWTRLSSPGRGSHSAWTPSPRRSMTGCSSCPRDPRGATRPARRSTEARGPFFSPSPLLQIFGFPSQAIRGAVGVPSGAPGPFRGGGESARPAYAEGRPSAVDADAPPPCPTQGPPGSWAATHVPMLSLRPREGAENSALGLLSTVTETRESGYD